MKIIFSKEALKFLKKQDKSTQIRILNAINKLPNGDVKKLRGTTGYRLRIGTFRVIFDRDDNGTITILDIENRGQAYK